MSQKALLGLLMGLIELDLRVNSSLLPKHRCRSSDLQMRKTVVVDNNDLLSLAEVGHVSLGIQPSRVVPRSSLLERPSCDQVILNLFS